MQALSAIRSLLQLSYTEASVFKDFCDLDGVLERSRELLENLMTQEDLKEYAREIEALRREVYIIFHNKLAGKGTIFLSSLPLFSITWRSINKARIDAWWNIVTGGMGANMNVLARWLELECYHCFLALYFHLNIDEMELCCSNGLAKSGLRQKYIIKNYFHDFIWRGWIAGVIWVELYILLILKELI